MEQEIIEKLIKIKDVRVFSESLFDFIPTKKQEEIIKTITYQEHKRVAISCMTRYGKTKSLSIAISLFILFNKNKRIIIISPTNDQNKILRNYIVEAQLKSPLFKNLIEIETTQEERTKKEVSRKRITYKNGCDILFFSAEGDADRLMGWGGDLIVCDEDALIDYKVWQTRISRMLGDSPDAIHVSLFNPWHKKNQAYECWTNPKYKKIHVNYKTALQEGRITKEYLEEQKQRLTPKQFKVLYESEFPDDIEDDEIIFKDFLIKAAQEREFKEFTPPFKRFLGVDVARFGKDFIVMTDIIVDSNNQIKIEDVHYYKHKSTMETAGKIINLDKKNNYDKIKIDEGSMGGGVVDRLVEQEDIMHKIEPVMFGSKVRSEKYKKICKNAKAEMYMNLLYIFRKNIIMLPEKFANTAIELNKMRYKTTSDGGKIIIVDPPKSPDFADSLALACYGALDELADILVIDGKQYENLFPVVNDKNNQQKTEEQKEEDDFILI